MSNNGTSDFYMPGKQKEKLLFTSGLVCKHFSVLGKKYPKSAKPNIFTQVLSIVHSVDFSITVLKHLNKTQNIEELKIQSMCCHAKTAVVVSDEETWLSL